MGTYHILESDGKQRAGITKPMKPGTPTMWLPYVQVGNADQSHDKAKKLGAQSFVAPMDIPDVGRFAVFADPNGAAIAILQPKR
jgi:predicted enzyme related to lactoylglutathione lyase